MRSGIEPFGPLHLPGFLTAAKAEGWISDPWEFEFLLKSFPEGCWVVLHEDTVAGFITAAKHDKSGWIGNLLVRKEVRGRGLGRALFERALDSLEQAGAGTVWLTASSDGEPLYRKLGFTAVDRIIRWRGKPGTLATIPSRSREYSLRSIEETDRMGWGDRRGKLLSAMAERGMVVQYADGFCMLQPAEESVQLGPWGCRRTEIAESLLAQALAAVSPSTEVVLDAPESNHHAATLLAAHGFVSCSASTLMYRGLRPDYRPERIFALASMGSSG